MSTVPPANTNRLANWLIATILTLVPFHAFLTVLGSSLAGHYTLLRLWNEALFALLLVIITAWLARDAATRRQLFHSLLFRLIIAYSLLSVALGLVALSKHEVNAKACGYALVVNLRFLLFFVAVTLAAQRSVWLRQKWPKLLIIPAALVCAFAVLQFSVLPHNFLSHFGYNASTTIAPTETINHNGHYIRVQSTLRGANPLGAYLVVPIALAATVFMRFKLQRLTAVSFGVLTGLALVFSFSRSAWIGGFLAVLVSVWICIRSQKNRIVFSVVTASVLLVLASALLLLRGNTGLQNALWHTQDHSQVVTSSNSAHVNALKSGVDDVLHEPFGRGPGTAGPESVYNTGHPTRIAENYFVQIAQETGWAGLLLLLAVMGLVATELYRLRKSVLGLTLFASLIGLTFVNLLSHAWADDTLAYVWWGLAGIAMARVEIGAHEIPD